MCVESYDVFVTLFFFSRKLFRHPQAHTVSSIYFCIENKRQTKNLINMSKKMEELNNTPTWVKIVKIIIAVLTAIIGFFTGAGVQAMTALIQ